MSANLQTMQPTPVTAPPGAIRVVLADDHLFTLWGLQQLVDSSSPHLCVVGSATSRDELLATRIAPVCQ
jgi:hypothetical protein